MVEKFAKSNDPVQQALRDHKKRWNIAAKEFRKRMQALSKGLNGKGDPAYGLPPTDIKESLPEELNSFLNELAGNFQQLAEEALKIQQEQALYSKNRRRPKPKSDNVYQMPNKQNPNATLEGTSLARAASVKTASAKTLINIAGNEIPTLLAITAQEQEQGLMYQEWPPPVMSFIYSSPRINRFWMKNTPSPLDIVFSLNGIVTAIHKGEPFSTQMIGDYSESDLVVELPYGTCAKMGIKIGDSIFLRNSARNL